MLVFGKLLTRNPSYLTLGFVVKLTRTGWSQVQTDL